VRCVCHSLSNVGSVGCHGSCENKQKHVGQVMREVCNVPVTQCVCHSLSNVGSVGCHGSCVNKQKHVGQVMRGVCDVPVTP